MRPYENNLRFAAVLARVAPEHNTTVIADHVAALSRLQASAIRLLTEFANTGETRETNRKFTLLSKRVEEAVDKATHGRGKVVWNDNGVSPGFYVALPERRTNEHSNSFDGRGWIVGVCP